MIKPLILMMVIISITARATLRLDPFNPPYTMTCQSITEQLQQQMALWQFYGVFGPYNENSIADNQQIWLKHQDGRWQSLSAETESNLFLPWRLQTFTDHQLIWQAELPKYCLDIPTFLMPLEGK
ncbi:hypothetical protein [Zophobihabitans entericus]|uniref:Uncharacterized protein n=1 Tax=Zophobihabitans entericus TaxID=1635327 RepID=A0A6G9I9N6_9GAMM|nr:hypothetical protein [Zophobihabitans entericus]QIQ20948.1 hypothetical protein IPMB12_04180 [Zophobihabitans entericus]